MPRRRPDGTTDITGGHERAVLSTTGAGGCYSLVYASRATAPMGRRGLVELLEQSRTRNAADDITGLLVYRDGTFVQLLEGDQQHVEDLYSKILVDPRHHDAVVVTAEQKTARQFPDWSMGFHDSESSAADLDGYSDVLDGDDHMRIETRFVLDLLSFFGTSTPVAGPDARGTDRPISRPTPIRPPDRGTSGDDSSP